MFEFLDLDLKKQMDSTPGFSKNHKLIKVRTPRQALLRGTVHARPRKTFGRLDAGPALPTSPGGTCAALRRRFL